MGQQSVENAETSETEFNALLIDIDHELTLWRVYGIDTTETMRRFMLDVFPESALEIAELPTYEAMVVWAKRRECHVDLIALN